VTLAQGVLLAAGAIVLAVLAPRPSRPERSPRRRRQPVRLRRGRRERQAAPDLAAVDRLLSMAVASAADEYARLRPLVGDIAAQRLADHAGVRIETAPDVAAAMLGPEVWEVIRPDRQRPPDAHARGIPVERLRPIVEALERIGAPA
jgi:hypothetical protein